MCGDGRAGCKDRPVVKEGAVDKANYECAISMRLSLETAEKWKIGCKHIKKH